LIAIRNRPEGARLSAVSGDAVWGRAPLAESRSAVPSNVPIMVLRCTGWSWFRRQRRRECQRIKATCDGGHCQSTRRNSHGGTKPIDAAANDW